MSSTNSKSCGKGVGDNNSVSATDLEKRFSDHEFKYLEIKTEFETLKSLNEELTSRHDKELKELKLDLRIAKRDADKWQDHNRYLREQKKELKDELNAIQTTNQELKQQMKLKDKKIEELVQQIEIMNEDFKSKFSDQKAIKDSYEDRIKRLNTETKELRERLNESFDWKQKFDETNRNSQQIYKEMEFLRIQNQSLSDQLISKDQQIEEKGKEINKVKKNLKVLQEECVRMDKQTEQFKNRYLDLGVLKEKMIAEKGSTQTEVEKLSHEIISLQNELKSAAEEKQNNKKQFEFEIMENQKMMSIDRQRITDLEQIVKELRVKNGDYLQRLRQFEDNCDANDNIITTLDSRISQYEEELIAIKEEAANHITTIGHLNESNQKLKFTLEEYIEKTDEMQTRIESLHHQLEIREEEMNRERITANETIQQHLKLNDFLQKRVESLEKQKKPLISLTPKKVNNSSPIYSQQLKDLDRLLAEERTKNRRLAEEISKLKTNSHSIKAEEISIKSDLSSTNASNQLFRRPLFSDKKNINSKKRVENRLQTHSTSNQCSNGGTHRFLSITNKIPNNKCVLCAQVIPFGKKANKCDGCSAIVHPKCGERLSTNCSSAQPSAQPPVQLVKQLFESTYNLNDNYYYQSRPIDDVIEVHHLEPSAPEETFTKYEDNSDSSATTDNNESDSGAIMSSALTEAPNYELKEIEDICDNKENDGFSFTDSLIEIIERVEHF